ncbi:MAG: ribosome silencing factor [Elusimicrobia bacterium]|nr:ribosome silencing factor [Elusimicrobiota bacterium]
MLATLNRLKNPSSEKPLRSKTGRIKALCRLLDERLAQDVHLLKIPHLSSVCDYVVLATATSTPHLEALERYCLRELKSWGRITRRPIEGKRSGGWRVVDAGFAVIHIMDQATRTRFHLENVWSKGRKVSFNPGSAVGR